MHKSLIFLPLVLLTGCTKQPINLYTPDDFINPNKVVVKEIKTPLPKPTIAATYGIGNDPTIQKAYQHFLKTGNMNKVKSSGFITYPYNAHDHPLLACEPLHLCVVQLEVGENINNIEIGDSAHWLVHTSLIGTETNGAYQVAIKPTDYNMATDMIITTSKRTYNLGLVSQKGKATHVVNFYYPEETLANSITQAQGLKQKNNNPNEIAHSAAVSLTHLYFNYTVSGDKPSWVPQRIFDDGDKTFIQLPKQAKSDDLPILYLLRNHDLQLTNYRYHRPYYIVDGVFTTAYLISGKGHHQTKVVIRRDV